MNFNVSEASYRSEAEDLMDGSSVYENVFVQKQSKINTQGCIELRRSQRLSQKNIFNGICTSCSNYNVYPKKIITTPPAIFSPTDLREDQEPYVLDVMAQNQEPPEFVPTLFPIETTTNQLGSLCCETLQTCEPISDLNIEQKNGFKNNSIDTKAKSIKARTNRARKPNRKTRPKPYKLPIEENATPTKLLSPTTLENSQGSCKSILLNKDFKNNGILFLQTSSTLTQKVKSPAGVAASSSTSTNVQKHCESSTKTSNVPCDTALNISNNEKLKEIPLNQLKPSLRKRSLRSIAMPDINSEQNKKTKTNSSTALTKTKRARKLNNTAQINNTIISGGINETIQEEESISAAPPFIFDLKQGFSFPLKSESICDSSVHENLNQMAEQNKYKNKNLSKSVKSSTKRSKLNCKIKSKQYKKPLRKIKFLSKIADMNSNIMDVLNAETTNKENSHEDYVPLDLSRSKSAESLIKTCIKKSSGTSISDKLPLVGMTSITCAKPIVSYLGDIDMTGAKSEIQDSKSVQYFMDSCAKIEYLSELNGSDIATFKTEKSNWSQPFVEDNLVISKKKRGGRPCKPLIKGKQENFFKSNDRTFISNNIDYSNEEFKFFSNASELELPAQTLSKMSTLPETYPPYFKYQLPPKAVFTQSLIPSQPNIMTPDDTPKSFELKDSTSTSPSLSESLQGIFDTDDLRHLLNIEKVSYRLYEYHVQVLAVVLNLQVDYLHDLLDKILKINPNALRKVNNALKTPFVPDHDIFEMKNSIDSQSPGVEIADSHSQEELS